MGPIYEWFMHGKQPFLGWERPYEWGGGSPPLTPYERGYFGKVAAMRRSL